MKGIKAFNKGLKCRDFQYEEGKEYKISSKPMLCERGFHFCENPLDVLDYYDLCESEFAEVESIGELQKEEDNSKVVTNNIKIKAKISLAGFIKASVDYVQKICKITNSSDSGDYSKLASSGYSSQLASSGYSSQLASSGYSSQLASSGDSSKLASSGDSSKLASSGDYSQLASSGDSSKLASSGDSSKLASSGYSSKLASSGDSSQLASSGYSSKLEISGKDSVGANIGYEGKIKGVLGSWITLAEYDDDGIIKCVKSAKITGRKLKPDTWYQLIDGKFTEVK